MKEPFKELDEFLKGFVEGTLTETEQRRFGEILKSDSSARRRYLDYIAVESMLGTHKLKLEAASTPSKVKLKISPEKNAEVKRKVAVKTRRGGTFLLLAAGIFLVTGLG